MYTNFLQTNIMGKEDWAKFRQPNIRLNSKIRYNLIYLKYPSQTLGSNGRVYVFYILHAEQKTKRTVQSGVTIVFQNPARASWSCVTKAFANLCSNFLTALYSRNSHLSSWMQDGEFFLRGLGQGALQYSYSIYQVFLISGANKI